MAIKISHSKTCDMQLKVMLIWKCLDLKPYTLEKTKGGKAMS